MKTIYLACPYGHADPNIRLERFNKVNEAAARIVNFGYCVFSPISHSHPIATSKYGSENLKNNHATWLSQDFHFVRFCDELWVLKLDGWKESFGVTSEIALAKSLDKKVRFFDESEKIADVDEVTTINGFPSDGLWKQVKTTIKI